MLSNKTRLISWLMIGTGLSFALYVGSNVGYQFTKQTALAQDWDKSHSASAFSHQPSAVIPLARPRLAVGQPLAKIVVPSIKWTGIVIEGTDNQSLAGGPGHLLGTAYPGEPDNVVISNHNSYSEQWSGVKAGDTIELDTDYGKFVYKVTGFKIVGSGDKSVTGSTGHASLTFTTCYPLWAGALARQRYVVFADLQT
jgi:sortase A